MGVGGWAFQFLGHAIEGNKPAFYADPRQFFMGPIFFLCKPLFWVSSTRSNYPKKMVFTSVI